MNVNVVFVKVTFKEALVAVLAIERPLRVGRVLFEDVDVVPLAGPG